MATYVLVHGAWHTGRELKEVATFIRMAGHDVHTPTLAGNREEDDRSTGLEEAIESLIEFIRKNRVHNAIIMGHSYGGMIVTAVASRLPVGVIQKIVYCGAFIPENNESMNDLFPAHYVEMFAQIEAGDGSVVLPFPIWRKAFINDASTGFARATYERLNPHPGATFRDRVTLQTSLTDISIPKSFVLCEEDLIMLDNAICYTQLSRRLGSFRLIRAPGSHELCFTNPAALAEKIMEAGCD